MAKGLPLERLRAYLRELTPEARALLLTEFERAALRGDEVPGGDVILEELRQELRNSARQATRVGTPERLFFKPLEPFLIDDAPDRRHRGRIPRVSLNPIWRWIGRDLMTAETMSYSDEIVRLLLTNDEAMSERLARAFQDQAVQRIREGLTAVKDDHKVRQRLTAQLGTACTLEDLREVVGVLNARDALAVFASRLPPHITNLADEQLDNVKALLDSPIGGHPDVFVYALVLVMSRLAEPWQLVRLAIRAADSDVATRVAGTPYAVAVSIVLGEMERMVGLLRASAKAGQFAVVGEILQNIHAASHTLRTELDLSGELLWTRQLAAIRGDASDCIRSQIEIVPDRMRRLLWPSPAGEIAPASVLDTIDVAETEALIELIATCRSYASEFAVNEVTQRVHSDLQNDLENGTPSLLDSLRSADEPSRAFRLSQIDAAVRFAAKLLGASYASLLAKAVEVTAHGGDRKTAQG